MAYRQIHVKIWKDSWFIKLSGKRKLHFIYLFSNEAASVSGIYELPIVVQAFETGLKETEIVSNLDYFEKAEKIHYDQERNVIWVKMLRKYNANPSPTIEKKILKDLKAIPDCDLKKAYCETYGYDIDTVSIGYIGNVDKKKVDR